MAAKKTKKYKFNTYDYYGMGFYEGTVVATTLKAAKAKFKVKARKHLGKLSVQGLKRKK